MNLSPTSRTLFLVQIGTFFSGLIVVVCNCLYISAYPKSPDAGSISAIAGGTLAFALFSTLTTLILVFRQKSGRTISAALEGGWVGLAIVLWILAAVGGIAKPANGMTRISCKVLPDGTGTDDKNFIRACQSIFASTAFCIVSALFFMATAGILIVFSFQRAARDRKAAKVKVGGSYELGPSPSQYRRAQQEQEGTTETPKDEESTGANAVERDTLLNSTAGATTPIPATATATPTAASATTATPTAAAAAAATSTTAGGVFSENVYRTPVLTHATTLAVTSPSGFPAPAANVQSGGGGVQVPYNGYVSGQHVPQASYHSQQMLTGYEYPIGGGHVQQGSALTELSVVGYEQPQQQLQPQPQQQQQQQVPLPYTTYPQMQPVYQQQQLYPPMQQTTPYGTVHSPYGTVHAPYQQPAPAMEMPRPEHFTV
ncbi:hypothetical protein BGZ94_008186 [Podila epigama]|nr:hypothetical protein BGZ94_008186 [Podila epigama]